MLTAILIWIDIRHPQFNPDLLYIGTVLIDLAIIDNFGC